MYMSIQPGSVLAICVLMMNSGSSNAPMMHVGNTPAVKSQVLRLLARKSDLAFTRFLIPPLLLN